MKDNSNAKAIFKEMHQCNISTVVLMFCFPESTAERKPLKKKTTISENLKTSG